MEGSQDERQQVNKRVEVLECPRTSGANQGSSKKVRRKEVPVLVLAMLVVLRAAHCAARAAAGGTLVQCSWCWCC